jgi:hypothetical protein
VYPKNNREVMLKVYLGLERTMETNLNYASTGCPKNVDNPKRDMVADMQRSTYLRPYLFRTGDA